jgi:hypothetical protein
MHREAAGHYNKRLYIYLISSLVISTILGTFSLKNSSHGGVIDVWSIVAGCISFLIGILSGFTMLDTPIANRHGVAYREALSLQNKLKKMIITNDNSATAILMLMDEMQELTSKIIRTPFSINKKCNKRLAAAVNDQNNIIDESDNTKIPDNIEPRYSDANNVPLL